MSYLESLWKPLTLAFLENYTLNSSQKSSSSGGSFPHLKKKPSTICDRVMIMIHEAVSATSSPKQAVCPPFLTSQ